MSDRDNSVPVGGACEYCVGEPFCNVPKCPYVDPTQCKSRKAYEVLLRNIIHRDKGLEAEVKP